MFLIYKKKLLLKKVSFLTLEINLIRRKEIFYKKILTKTFKFNNYPTLSIVSTHKLTVNLQERGAPFLLVGFV